MKQESLAIQKIKSVSYTRRISDAFVHSSTTLRLAVDSLTLQRFHYSSCLSCYPWNACTNAFHKCIPVDEAS